MEQKRVSFEVAKAIKEIGYPQGVTDEVYMCTDFYLSYEGELTERQNSYYEDDIADAPYILEVWLWLWREKREILEPVYYLEKNKWYVLYDCHQEITFTDDPEEAIEKAIEFIFKNDLIK